MPVENAPEYPFSSTPVAGTERDVGADGIIRYAAVRPATMPA